RSYSSRCAGFWINSNGDRAALKPASFARNLATGRERLVQPGRRWKNRNRARGSHEAECKSKSEARNPNLAQPEPKQRNRMMKGRMIGSDPAILSGTPCRVVL